MSRRRRSVEDLPYDPKNPPVIIDLSPIVYQCLTTQGFNDRLVEEIKSFVCLFRMPEAQYKYNNTEHKQLTWCQASLKKRSFSAKFGPRDIFTVFRANEDGQIQINTNTPLAKELLDVQDNGLEICFRGQKRERRKYWYDEDGGTCTDEDDDIDVRNHSHLFELSSYRKSDTSSTTTYAKCLKCFIVYPHIVFVEERNYTYAGKHGDYEETCCVEFHACSLTDDLISMLNNGLANLMKQISEKSEDLPRARARGSLLSLLTGHINEKRCNLECIFELEQSDECGEDDS